VFGYGTLGPYLAATSTAYARTCESAHRQRSIDATGLLSATAATTGAPTSSAGVPNLTLPAGVSNDPSARALAILLEEACSSAWRYALAQLATGSADPSIATWWPFALAGLSDSAVRAVHWRRIGTPATASVAFPGVS
jgi:Domain of unknown function (DUF4439)